MRPLALLLPAVALLVGCGPWRPPRAAKPVPEVRLGAAPQAKAAPAASTPAPAPEAERIPPEPTADEPPAPAPLPGARLVTGRAMKPGRAMKKGPASTAQRARLEQPPNCPFPRAAKAAKVDRVAVKLSVAVAPDGTVTKTRVLSDPGHRLGMSAQRCVEGLRFTPARNADNRPVADTVVMRVRYVSK